MKHLKKFFEHKISYFDKEGVKQILPKELEIVTNDGNFKLTQTDLTINDGLIQFIYHHSVWGQPDYLEFDLYLVKVNDGDVSNSNIMRIDVDITYGDAMVSEFTITQPNKVSIEHYTGKGSKYDPDTFFGFSDDSLNKLIKLFNSFGYSLEFNQFLFIDKENDDYLKVLKSLK